MILSKIAAKLECDLICGGDNMDKSITSACGADLMSDVLAFAKAGSVLLTGMVNQHVVRTAEMLDVTCIIFVRGKKPNTEICDLANKTGITIMTCQHSLYEACGLLYQAGLPPCSRL